MRTEEEIRARKKNWEIYLTGVLAHLNIDPEPEDSANLKLAEMAIQEHEWVLNDKEG